MNKKKINAIITDDEGGCTANLKYHLLLTDNGRADPEIPIKSLNGKSRIIENAHGFPHRTNSIACKA